jgi:hypothetical protein
MVSALQLPKIKRYRVYLELRTRTGIWVEAEGCNKAEAQFKAYREAVDSISEGEAEPYWHVVPQKTCVVKEDK